MYTGNSVIVNIFMKWPVLVPVAAAIGITTAVIPPKEEPKQVLPVVSAPAAIVVPTVIPPSVPTSAPTKKKKG